MSVSSCLWFWGKCSHHMIWLEAAEVNTWSSVVSWQAVITSQTGKVQTRHDSANNTWQISLFIFPCLFIVSSQPVSVILLWRITLSYSEAECSNDFFPWIIDLLLGSVALLPLVAWVSWVWLPECLEKGCWTSVIYNFLDYPHFKCWYGSPLGTLSKWSCKRENLDFKTIEL